MHQDKMQSSCSDVSPTCSPSFLKATEIYLSLQHTAQLYISTNKGNRILLEYGLSVFHGFHILRFPMNTVKSLN